MLEGDFETAEAIIKDIGEHLALAKTDLGQGFNHAAINRLVNVRDWCTHLETNTAGMIAAIREDMAKEK